MSVSLFLVRLLAALLLGLLVLALVDLLWLLLLVLKKDAIVQGLAYSFTGVEKWDAAALSGSMYGALLALPPALDVPPKSIRSPELFAWLAVVGI